MRIRTGLTAKFAPALALLLACSASTSRAPARGILVIAIDGLRFDHLGVAGYDRPTSPALDALAAEGVFFRQTWAAAPWQVPAHMSLLSGADPRVARRIIPPGVQVNQATQWHLPDEAPHPAAQLLSAGFRTALFYDHENLAPVYGYQRGFELYQGPSSKEAADHGSEAVFRRFAQWLSRTPPQKSWFAYLELADLERVWSDDLEPRWDTHFPPRAELSSVPPVGEAQHLFFAIPRSRWSRGMSTLGEYEARYDGAILQLDVAFRRLRTHLEQSGRFENTTVVVVGAYGTSFGESGLLLDSGTFSDSDLHVPLIVRPGRDIPVLAGSKSDVLVSTVDVLPTLLEISGLQNPFGEDGAESFAPALSGGETERDVAHASCGFQDGFAVIDGRYCFERTWPGRTLDRQYTFDRSGPGRTKDQLSASWFGDDEGRLDVMREVLHDRLKEPGRLGHVLSTNGDPQMSKVLAERGESWSVKSEARRARLQGPGSLFTRFGQKSAAGR